MNIPWYKPRREKSSSQSHCECLPFDCSSAFRPPRAAPAAALFTADCAAAPAALTNERPIILWGVSRLMAAAAAHSPADDLGLALFYLTSIQ